VIPLVKFPKIPSEEPEKVTLSLGPGWKVPVKITVLLASITVTVLPLAISKQPLPHEAPRLIEYVMLPAVKAPPSIDNEPVKLKVKLPPVVTLPVRVAGLLAVATEVKSTVVASAAVGSASASNANIITRLIFASSVLLTWLNVWFLGT